MPRFSPRTLIGVGAASVVVVVVVVLASGALSSSAVVSNVPTADVIRGPFQVTHVEAGELRAARDEKVVAPRVRGQLKIVHLYPEGARVEVGDLILQFDREQHAQEVKDNAGRLEQVKEDMRKTRAQQDRKRAELVMQVEHRTAALALARISLQRSEFGSPVQKEEAKIRLENAVRALKQAETNVEAQIIIDRVELANRELRIGHRQKDYDRSLSDYERLSIKAKRPGIIVYEKIRKRGTDRRGKVTEGDVVWGGTSLLALPELDSMQVYSQVGEMDVQRVKPRQPATIRLEAYPGPIFEGIVRDVSPMANELEHAPNVQVFEIVVDILQHDDRLYPGMSASVEIVIQAFDDVLTIPLGALHRDQERTFVYRRRDSTFEPVDVVVGSNNGLRVVVEEGLTEGDAVALSDIGLL